MPAPANLVHQTSTSTGASTFTLTAVNGKQSFATAFSTGVTTNVFDYFISNQDAAEWERGTGHMSDATTLVRDTVIQSTNSNNAVTFSAGTKDVINDIPAATQARLDAANTWTATQTLASSGLVVGASTPFSDSAGTLTLQNVDALDSTTESTIEAAIDTCANLTSIQGLTVTLADAGADAVLGWDDSQSAYENLTAAEVVAIITAADGTGSGLDADLLDGKNTGTSGNVVPLLDGANTWSATQTTQTILPSSDGAYDLGSTTAAWNNLHLDTGATINVENGNWVATHSSAILTVGTGDLRVTTAGTDTASVVTVGGTQTLTAKTLTSPTIGTSPTAAGATWTSLGTVTTIDINGGTVDGTAIGGGSASTGAFTTLTASTSITEGGTRVGLVGKQTIWVPASAMTPAASNGAAATTRAINTITTGFLAFDQTTSESAYFNVTFPKSWNESTVTAQVFWTTTGGAGAETLEFEISGGCFANDAAINVTGIGTAVAHTDTWIADDDVHVTAEGSAITLSNAAVDTVAWFRIVRDVANDTLTADAELIGVKMFYTTDAGNDA
jgi:hypothetical protein